MKIRRCFWMLIDGGCLREVDIAVVKRVGDLGG